MNRHRPPPPPPPPLGEATIGSAPTPDSKYLHAYPSPPPTRKIPKVAVIGSGAAVIAALAAFVLLRALGGGGGLIPGDASSAFAPVAGYDYEEIPPAKVVEHRNAAERLVRDATPLGNELVEDFDAKVVTSDSGPVALMQVWTTAPDYIAEAREAYGSISYLQEISFDNSSAFYYEYPDPPGDLGPVVELDFFDERGFVFELAGPHGDALMDFASRLRSVLR